MSYTRSDDSVRDPAGKEGWQQTTTTEYDNTGNVTEKTEQIDSDRTAKTEYTYDKRGNLVMVKSCLEGEKEPDGSSAKNEDHSLYVQYVYDIQGNKVRQFKTEPLTFTVSEVAYAADDADTFSYAGKTYQLTVSGKKKTDTVAETKYEYDGNNQLTAYTDPEGRRETYTYDINSNLTKTVDKNGNILKNTYDYQNRLTEALAKEKKTGKETVHTYTYNAYGDVATQDNTTFVYEDASGQVTKETTKLTKNKDVVKNYTYDSAGNKSAFSIKVGDDTKLSLQYAYDRESRLTAVTDEKGKEAVRYTYDIDGNLAERTVSGNTLTTTYTYDYQSRLTAMKNQTGSEDISYTYDSSNNRKENIKSMKRIIISTILMILCSGCSYHENIIIPDVALFEDYVDCNQDYIVEIRESDEGSVIDVIQEGIVISQLQCDIEPEMVAVGQKGYYLLDKSEDLVIIVNFDSEIIAKKKIPEDVNNVSCRNGYVFMGKYSQEYLDEINADYFFEEDNHSEDIQILTQENIDTLTGITFYRSYEGYSTEPVLNNYTKFYENEDIQGKGLLDKREEYAFLREKIQSEDICHVVEYQKGCQIYGWINCYNDFYLESLENKQQPRLSSITKGIAYKINTQNGKTEILEDREEGILFSSEDKIVYIQENGEILCHYIKQEKIKEIACIELHNVQPCICFKKDLMIWYDEDALAHIIRY